MQPPRKIILSRTDSIGDVILTLPLAGLLKQLHPETEIIFLGSDYTRDVIDACKHIDKFEGIDTLRSMKTEDFISTMKSWEADCIIHAFPRPNIARIAKHAGVSIRIGASGRLYHYKYCNKIVPLSRKRSLLHEAQLNLKLAKPLGAKTLYSLDEIKNLFGFRKSVISGNNFSNLLQKDKFNLIIHPKSKGSAREWGLTNFRKLIDLLPNERFAIFVTGTESEGELIRNELPLFFKETTDMTGKLTLKELIHFIQAADGLVAASTGPLHIAAVSGIVAIGLYPPIRPMHPGRWAPLGDQAIALVKDKECSVCRGGTECECIREISPEEVKNKLLQMTHARK